MLTFLLVNSILTKYILIIVNVPQEAQAYYLPNIDRTVLENLRLDVDRLNVDSVIKTFIYKLHQAVRNSLLDTNTSEAMTDTLVAHLLFRTVNFDKWPLVVR
jgi:hypothetical protein